VIQSSVDDPSLSSLDVGWKGRESKSLLLTVQAVRRATIGATPLAANHLGISIRDQLQTQQYNSPSDVRLNLALPIKEACMHFNQNHTSVLPFKYSL